MEAGRILKRNPGRRGQMRVIESILATIVVALSIFTMMNLMQSANPYTSKTRAELVRYSYDFLMSLAQKESFDKIIFMNSSVRQGWEQLMKVTLSSLLPANMLYNMTVYNMTSINGTIREVVLNNDTITNVMSANDFLSKNEAAAADVTYTTRKLWVIKVHMELARG